MWTPEGRGPALDSDSTKRSLHRREEWTLPRTLTWEKASSGWAGCPGHLSAVLVQWDLRPQSSLLTGPWAHLPDCPLKLQVEQVPRDLAGASVCLPCTHLMGREPRSWSCVNNSPDLLKPAGLHSRASGTHVSAPPAEGSPICRALPQGQLFVSLKQLLPQAFLFFKQIPQLLGVWSRSKGTTLYFIYSLREAVTQI